jgi:hypothetical protein
MPKKKTPSKKKAKKQPKKKVVKKAALKSKSSGAKKATGKPKPVARRRRASSSGAEEFSAPAASARSGRGLGPGSGGQSGDIQGLSRRERYDSESVEELAEEGQALEAEAVSGVENALDPDQGEVRTSEVPEDDVPDEYLDEEQ